MVDRHICQLRDDQKVKLLTELYDVLSRFQALDPKKEPAYKDDDLPNFLKKRVPRFKANQELWPLITNCSTFEVRLTTNPKCLQHQDEDPNVVFVKIDSPSNPFKADSGLNDDLCEDFCSHQVPGGGTGNKQGTTCPVHGPSGEMSGTPYQCTHDDKCRGIVICTDPKGRSYLCTVHVQPKKAG